jgi:hypothetical protein
MRLLDVRRWAILAATAHSWAIRRAYPYQAKCCLENSLECLDDIGVDGCKTWCTYTADHFEDFHGDGCYAFRHLCPMCYLADDEMPFRLLTAFQTRHQSMVEMVADCTHISLPFYGNALCQHAVGIMLSVYAWETTEWLNNRFSIVDSYSWDDPLDDIYTGILGVAWGQAFASAWRAPKVWPAADLRTSVKIVLMSAVYGAGCSFTMSLAWHTPGGGGGVEAPSFLGLLRYTIFSGLLSFVFAWANSRSPGDLVRWRTPELCRGYWYARERVHMLQWRLWIPAEPCLHHERRAGGGHTARHGTQHTAHRTQHAACSMMAARSPALQETAVSDCLTPPPLFPSPLS